MGNIVLKTARRSTSIPRLAMRRVVEAVYAGTVTPVPAVTHTSPVVKLVKKTSSKKAS